MKMTTHYVYVICPETELGHVKVGITSNIQRRLTELQTGHPERLKVYHKKQVPSRADAKRLEVMAHARMVQWRQTGEWFDVQPDFARTVVENVGMTTGLDPDALVETIAALQARFDQLKAEDQRLTECLTEARALLDDVQRQWSANLTEWTKVRAELDYFKSTPETELIQ